MIRRTIAVFTLVALGLIMGCASWLANQGGPQARVATYIKVAPKLEVGLDGCGSSWVKFTDTNQCFTLSAAGDSMIPITCPSPGDTLAVAR